MNKIDDILKHTAVQYAKVVKQSAWRDLEVAFRENKVVLICTHGGNIAVARHVASDLSRHLNWQKNIEVPDSDTVAIWHGDFNYETWLVDWIRTKTSGHRVSDVLVIGVSSSGASPDVDYAVEYALGCGFRTAYISAQPVRTPGNTINITTGVRHYYASEVMLMSLGQRLLNSCGKGVQPLKTLSPDAPITIRDNSDPDELVNIGIDFDGVMHLNSKGFYDGTIYDIPVPGTRDALKALSEKYNIIIYTCKAKPDRELVHGQTGTELVWRWLEEHNMAQYVSGVTSDKPRAVFYIDDKAIRFDNWEKTFNEIGEYYG